MASGRVKQAWREKEAPWRRLNAAAYQVEVLRRFGTGRSLGFKRLWIQPAAAEPRMARRQTAGVSPVTRRKARVKCA